MESSDQAAGLTSLPSYTHNTFFSCHYYLEYYIAEYMIEIGSPGILRSERVVFNRHCTFVAISLSISPSVLDLLIFLTPSLKSSIRHHEAQSKRRGSARVSPGVCMARTLVLVEMGARACWPSRGIRYYGGPDLDSSRLPPMRSPGSMIYE
jgi:hypothetical protein